MTGSSKIKTICLSPGDKQKCDGHMDKHTDTELYIYTDDIIESIPY